MKLINPTDDELDAAFAEKVCGANATCDGMMRLPDEQCGGQTFESWKRIPEFTASADAVLPWLEKFGWKGTSNRCGSTCAATVFVVIPHAIEPPFEVMAQADYETSQNPLPRAAAIALLRAVGVEVVTTEATP